MQGLCGIITFESKDVHLIVVRNVYLSQAQNEGRILGEERVQFILRDKKINY